MRPLIVATCAALVLVASMAIRADVVTLRSGVKFTDVKAKPSATSHRLYFIDGSTIIISNSQIVSVRPGPTSWTEAVMIEPIRAEAFGHPDISPRESREIAEVPRARAWGPVLKSAVLPGWGQISEGRTVSGANYAVAALLLVHRYWTIRQDHARAEAEYNDPTLTGAVAAQTLTGRVSVTEAAAVNLTYLSAKERQVYRLEKQGNLSLFLLGSLWAWNMLDILSGGAPWEWKWLGNAQNPAHVSLVLCPGREGMLVAVRLIW